MDKGCFPYSDFKQIKVNLKHPCFIIISGMKSLQMWTKVAKTLLNKHGIVGCNALMAY